MMNFSKNRLKQLLTILLLGSYISLLGQYSFQKISKADGLSHNNVECIMQDSEGFMWFGTRNGLCRYDGYEIKVFRSSSNPNSISGNRILSIAEDNNGFIWVGTYQNGLNRFDKRKSSFTHFNIEQGIGNQVYRIKKLSDGSISIGSNNGLSIYDSDTDSFVNYVPDSSEKSVNSHLVSDILETKDKSIFIATWENDIQEFDKSKGEFKSIKYIKGNQPVVNYRKRLLEDLNGNIWISAQKHGLCRYNREKGDIRFFHNNSEDLNTEILNGDMILSPDGNIWVATDEGGINIYNTNTNSFEYITQQTDFSNSLISNHIYTLYLDNSNRVWVGTFDQGVAFFDPQMNKFKSNIISDNVFSFFKGKSILSLFQDKNETLWIGTDGHGLHSIDYGNKLKSYYHDPANKNSLSSNVITSLCDDADGNLLIGTYTGGLNKFNSNTQQFERFRPDSDNGDAIHSENVWSIIRDSEGNNWLGLLGSGADIFDSRLAKFKNIGPYSNELIKVGHQNVMSILEDSDGDIWFGTEGHGVYIFDKQAGKVLKLPLDINIKSLSNGIIKDIFQSITGDIWIATEGDGLYKYSEVNKSLKQYTTSNGLPGMIVMAIEEDNAGDIWVSTYDGLALLRKKTDSFTAFFNHDGLVSNEFNPNSFIKLRDGSLVVGSINGINVFNPHAIQYNQIKPKVYFTKLNILNQEVFPGDTINKRIVLDKDILYTKEIELKYSDKIFSIEFVALNLTLPQKCQYKYMLEGFDKDWIYTNPLHRFATYSNLKEGQYTFKVQASNNDGVWGETSAELIIIVLPPFWKTNWFISFVLLAIAGTFILVYIYRMRALKNKFLKEQVINQNRILELENENIEAELEKLTYYTINRNRVLVNYKNRLHLLSNQAKESVKKGLNVVIDEIDKEINDDKEWKYLEPRLDKFYNNFISQLRKLHPDLTLSEIKIATYVRMNLTSKEISEFMNKTIRAVENDRYRLRKKINLDSNESLQNYLMNL